MKKIILCFALIFSLCTLHAEDKQPPLVIHEWGTFTSLQDEQGNAIGGINTDDEPVPAFVHRLSYNLLTSQSPNGSLTANQYLCTVKAPGVFLTSRSGGAPQARSFPDVTMRLETPVLYFYPPADWKPQTIDVHVAFPGGWLSEFYPDARSDAPGFDPKATDNFGRIRKDAVGKLSWNGLKIGIPGTGPETKEKVWLAPRGVKSTQVTAANGESEKFLFYRGMGNVDASLRVVRDSAGGLEIHDAVGRSADAAPRIRAAWLVDVREDGVCAFKSLGALESGKGIRARMPGSFSAGEFSTQNMARLRNDMRGALIREGLFADEADALLNTWEVSYFKSSGLRFFYLCPRAQIDQALPLQISVPASVSRVMIGRIEIVTPEQRALLKEIASGPPAGTVMPDAMMNADYFNLGRFRNALILDEQKRRPTTALNYFINRYGLAACKIDDSIPGRISSLF